MVTFIPLNYKIYYFTKSVLNAFVLTCRSFVIHLKNISIFSIPKLLTAFPLESKTVVNSHSVSYFKIFINYNCKISKIYLFVFKWKNSAYFLVKDQYDS